MHDMQDVEQLALIFVQPLDLYVKNRVDIDRDPVVDRNIFSQFLFFLPPDQAQSILYFRFVSHLFQRLQP